MSAASTTTTTTEFDETTYSFTATENYSNAADDGLNDDDGFADYVVDTVNPAPWALVLTTLVSALMIALVPLCVVIGDKLDRRWKKQRAEKQQQQQQQQQQRTDEAAANQDDELNENHLHPQQPPQLPPQTSSSSSSSRIRTTTTTTKKAVEVEDNVEIVLSSSSSSFPRERQAHLQGTALSMTVGGSQGVGDNTSYFGTPMSGNSISSQQQQQQGQQPQGQAGTESNGTTNNRVPAGQHYNDDDDDDDDMNEIVFTRSSSISSQWTANHLEEVTGAAATVPTTTTMSDDELVNMLAKAFHRMSPPEHPDEVSVVQAVELLSPTRAAPAAAAALDTNHAITSRGVVVEHANPNHHHNNDDDDGDDLAAGHKSHAEKNVVDKLPSVPLSKNKNNDDVKDDPKQAYLPLFLQTSPRQQPQPSPSFFLEDGPRNYESSTQDASTADYQTAKSGGSHDSGSTSGSSTSSRRRRRAQRSSPLAQQQEQQQQDHPCSITTLAAGDLQLEQSISHGSSSDDDGSHHSVYSYMGLAATERIFEEYVETKEIWHPKGRDHRRIQGGAKVVQALLGGGGGRTLLEDDDDNNDDEDNDNNNKRNHNVYSNQDEENARAAARHHRHRHHHHPDQEENVGDDERSTGSSSSSTDSTVIIVKGMKQYKFYKCDGDTKGIIRLALPFTIHTAVIFIVELMELAVIGRLLGTDSLSSLLIVDLVFSLSTMFMQGAMTSLFTLVSQAVGGEKYYLAGQYVQIAVVFYQALLLPLGVIGWFVLEDIVLLFGFSQQVADISMAYAQVEFVSYLFKIYKYGLEYILEVIEQEVFTAIFAIIESVISFLAIYCLAKYNEPSLRDVALLGLALDVFFTIVFVVCVAKKGWLNDFWPGLIGNFAPMNFQGVKVFLKTSIPLSLGYIMSTGEWETLTLFAGFLGPAEVSAWGLLGWFWEAIEEITLAVANAAEVKVGKMMGSGQPFRARSIANKSLFLGIITSILVSLPIFAMNNVLPSFFTTDPTLQAMLADLFPLVGIGNIALMFGSMCWTLIGAQGRYALATALGFVGSWGLTIPLAAILTLVLRFDLQAMTGAVVIGYACSGSLTASFLFRTDWQLMSAKVIRDTNKGAGFPDTTDPLSMRTRNIQYDDLDWDELPPNVRSAAQSLGYNEHMWKNNLEPAAADRGWRRLTPEEREAASMLGFDKEKWDED
ncbi:hypothetical protein ACA910_004596 [Epithemia clementina (nom. ined.)]